MRIPPHADVFARVGEFVQILNRLTQTNRLANLLETKRGLDFQCDRDEQTGATETAEGGHEEIRVFRSGTLD
jgi:hypothetical protein